MCVRARSRLTLCDPMDCSPPDSSVHGILQARTREWVAMPSSRAFLDPGIELASLVSPALASGFFTTSTTWEAHKRVQTDTCTQMHTTRRHTHTHAQSNYEGLILLTVAFGSMLRNSASLL